MVPLSIDKPGREERRSTPCDDDDRNVDGILREEKNNYGAGAREGLTGD